MEIKDKELELYKESQYRLRTAIGVLGILLPFLVLHFHGWVQLSSLSHYYYTKGSIFFTGILMAFGIILIAYRGYSFEENKLVDDGFVTTLAGICILIAVIIPTSSKHVLGDLFFHGEKLYLFGHKCDDLGTIHLVSAGLFLVLLGYMCIFKFTQNPDEEGRNTFYKTCGYIVWFCVAFIAVVKILNDQFKTEYFENTPYIFWLEAVAVWAFGSAWLLKGKIDRSIVNITSTIKKKIFNK